MRKNEKAMKIFIMVSERLRIGKPTPIPLLTITKKGVNMAILPYIQQNSQSNKILRIARIVTVVLSVRIFRGFPGLFISHLSRILY